MRNESLSRFWSRVYRPAGAAAGSSPLTDRGFFPPSATSNFRSSGIPSWRRWWATIRRSPSIAASVDAQQQRHEAREIELQVTSAAPTAIPHIGIPIADPVHFVPPPPPPSPPPSRTIDTVSERWAEVRAAASLWGSGVARWARQHPVPSVPPSGGIIQPRTPQPAAIMPPPLQETPVTVSENADEDDASYQQLLFFAGLLLGPLLFVIGATLLFATPPHLKNLRRWGMLNLVMAVLSIVISLYVSLNDFTTFMWFSDHVERYSSSSHVAVRSLTAEMWDAEGGSVQKLAWDFSQGLTQLTQVLGGSHCDESAVRYGSVTIGFETFFGQLDSNGFSSRNYTNPECRVYASPRFRVRGTLMWQTDFGPSSPCVMSELHSARRVYTTRKSNLQKRFASTGSKSGPSNSLLFGVPPAFTGSALLCNAEAEDFDDDTSMLAAALQCPNKSSAGRPSATILVFDDETPFSCRVAVITPPTVSNGDVFLLRSIVLDTLQV